MAITIALLALVPGSLQEVYNNYIHQTVGAGTIRLWAIELWGAGRIYECLRLKKSPTEMIGEVTLLSLNTVQLFQLFVYG